MSVRKANMRRLAAAVVALAMTISLPARAGLAGTLSDDHSGCSSCASAADKTSSDGKAKKHLGCHEAPAQIGNDQDDSTASNKSKKPGNGCDCRSSVASLTSAACGCRHATSAAYLLGDPLKPTQKPEISVALHCETILRGDNHVAILLPEGPDPPPPVLRS